MMFTNSALAAFLLIASSPAVTPFVPTTKPSNQESRTTSAGSKALFLSPEDLTNYMAKAHEESSVPSRISNRRGMSRSRP